MLTYKRKMDKLIRKSVEVVIGYIRNDVPQQGSFERVGIRYHHPGNKFMGMLCVEADLKQAESRRLVASMFRKGEDRLVSNFLMKGTNQEILDYLGAEKTISELIGVFEHLKEKVENLER